VALAWIALAFLPASNLLVPTGQVLAERTLYLPSVGAMMLAAWLLDRLASRFERNAPNRALRGLVAASALGIAWIGASRTLSQTVLWQDNFTLFQSGIAAAPSSARPLWLMGNLHISRGDVRKGLVYLARAHRLDPADPAVVYYYTRALHDVGNHELELAVLRDARRRITGSQSEQIRVMYRIALSQSRGPDSVIADVRADPSTDSVALHWKAVFLTEAFERKGMPDSALAAYRSALALQPGDGFLHFLYAKLLHDRGLDAQAASQLALAEAYPGGTKPESLARLRTEIESRRGQRPK
jgi:tetratricopeptide (TPR) repeat protein